MKNENNIEIMDIPLYDYSAILSCARRMNKKSFDHINLKVAVIGSYSTQYICSVMKAMLQKNGIIASVYEGIYNGIISEVMDENSGLYQFNPDIVIVLQWFRDITELPCLFSSQEQIESMLEGEVDRIFGLIDILHSRLGDTQILMSNIVTPFVDSLNNLQSNYIFSESYYYDLINIKLINKKPKYVTIFDVEGLSREYGKRNWFDDSVYYLSKLGFSLKYIGYFCFRLTRIINAMLGMTKKCLVIDLDNTIWGGEVGDLGTNGINLDPNNPEGEAYLEFQAYLKKMVKQGVILAVCSKNDESNAIDVFRNNSNMILKEEDISCFIANWDDKATNIQLIANTLNIGLDSIVFFDDNPTEREIIKKFLPEVDVVEVSEDPSRFINDLYDCHSFEWVYLSNEDVRRTATYRANIEREKLKNSSVDYDAYLRSLKLEGSFDMVNDDTVDRFVQLLNKTNQFNLMTNRYTEAEIDKLMSDEKYGLYTVSLQDRFSKYGVIACIVLDYSSENCIIKDWCMSCRILKKSVEQFTMNHIIAEARIKNKIYVVGKYRETKKNGMVRNLYAELGFEEVLSGYFRLNIQSELLYKTEVSEVNKCGNGKKTFI